MKRIYLDFAASTPVDPEVFAAMEPYFAKKFGNPGSLHSFGREAIAAVDRARETVARAVGADFRQIVFTSSATEANSLALRGAARRFREERGGRAAPRLIVSSVEHESVLETARAMEREGISVAYAPVDAAGAVDADFIKRHLAPETALVSVMYGQNETGTLEPVPEIARIVADFRRAAAPPLARPLFHTDAAQAFQFFDCSAGALGADLVTISSQKIYGPKGAAALFVKDLSALAPALEGGGQEFGLRSGTENVPAIVGFAKAVELAVAAREKESARLAPLAARLAQGIRTRVPGAEINGAEPGIEAGGSGGRRLPHIVNIYFPGRAADELLTKFDLAGLAVSSGSACRARAAAPSYVIAALAKAAGFGEVRAKDRARGSIRFSLGRGTSADEIEEAIKLVAEAAA